MGGRCTVTSRPKIGIAGATRTETERAAFEQYVEAVEAAGGDPVPVLPGALDGILDTLDGLVLTGGLDIDPQRYGEETRAGYDVEVDAERDALELPLACSAVERDLPVLAICRGVQVLNVALGGTLVQDIDRERTGEQAWSHQQRTSRPDAPHDAALHEVEIAPDSRLHEIVAADTLGVNTFHHQAINRPAPPLVVTARLREPGAPAVIEAVEAPGRRFVLGVQWHPERMWRRVPACARLFTALVQAARRARVR